MNIDHVSLFVAGDELTHLHTNQRGNVLSASEFAVFHHELSIDILFGVIALLEISQFAGVSHISIVIIKVKKTYGYKQN